MNLTTDYNAGSCVAAVRSTNLINLAWIYVTKSERVYMKFFTTLPRTNPHQCTMNETNSTSLDQDSVSFAVSLTLGMIGILGNTLVCITIIRAKFMHNITNFLISHLALVDLLVCLTNILFLERDNNHAPANELMKAQRKVARVVLVIVGAYFMLWVPFLTLYTIAFITDEQEGSFSWPQFFPVINSVINPIIYSFMYKSFQRGVREAVIPCCFKKHNRIAARNVHFIQN
ncbi:uncharacterized protein [Asterias amurensis]|uniref:uncharacterized protein n=1 Tax=Asterias amurensis TaxID=7602 RepID=UPI003AB4BF22